ncbi:hypothetical protein BBD41_26465 [Paenibacillus ihbetae]|uniref:Uncharacterized protein n=1 Tax=Paenibacillus ihbetae TaxID=1870820 RepID=A0A1B2E789_9BACL|nr:hypothetical protein [Paenibacillus ihbetae]ANY75833.1 hypothetical protein BBD41_26465 [Paenibacillus ihbetae]
MSETNHNGNQPTKADVQRTELNKMPVPGDFETGISEEEVTEAFNQQQQPSAGQQSDNQS